jgi:hypothetical protein
MPPNSRVIGRVCQSVSSVPYGSNVGLFAFVGIVPIPLHTVNVQAQLAKNVKLEEI